MMEFARREPIAAAGLHGARRGPGFSQTPVLPIVPSIDLCWSSSRQETLVLCLQKTGSVGAVVSPHGPCQARHLVSQRGRGFVMPPAFVNLQSPGTQAIDALLILGGQQHG